MIASWGRWPPGSNEPALDPRESGERKVNEIADCAAENGDRWDGKHGKAVRVQTQRTEQAEGGDVDKVDAERRAGEALRWPMQPLRLRAEGEQPGGHQARAGREALQKRRFQLPSFRREQPRPRKAEQKACGKQQPGAARGERMASERIAQHRAADGAPHHGKRPLADDPAEVLQQPDPEAEAREERRRRDEQAENEFAEVAEAHFELRKDFIKELPNSVFKQHMKEIALFCVATTESIDDGYCNSINPRLCAQLLGMRLSPDDENEDFCDMGFVRSAAEAQPEKLIFCCCYSALDDEDMSYYRRVWNMNHYEYELCENSDLDHIYEILETLGYEKSDDEEEMAEGTHRLFTIYGAAEDSDDDREETE